MREISSVAPASTPVNSTPTKKQRVESATSKLFTTDPVAQGIALKKREDLMATTEKRNRKFGNPQDGILWWLHANCLSIQRSISSKKALNLMQSYKSISTDWYTVTKRLKVDSIISHLDP